MTVSLESPVNIPRSRPAARWEDYLAVRDDPAYGDCKVAFYQGWLWVEMGKEGINHASFSDLLTMLFGFWAFLHPEETYASLGRCLVEQVNTHACAPDLVVYKGQNIPQWQTGEPRKIEIPRHRIPDLVGEIADTSLSQDLDEQKHLYASLGIPEYWVIDVKGLRVFAFTLQESGEYQRCTESQVFTGLPIDLIEQTLAKMTTSTNTAAATWFMQQLQAGIQDTAS